MAAELTHTADGLGNLPGVHALHVDGDRVEFDVDTAHLEDAVRRLGGLPGGVPTKLSVG